MKSHSAVAHKKLQIRNLQNRDFQNLREGGKAGARFGIIGFMTEYMFLAAAAAVCAAAAFCVWRIAKSQADAAKSAAREEIERMRAMYESALSATEDKFRTVAQKVLEDRGRRIDSEGRDSLRNIVDPLAKRISEYERKIEDFKGANEKLGQKMSDELAHLQRFAEEARKYTGALLGGTKIQGVWGENILRHTLEASGLVEGEHFDLQKAQENGVPDAWIYDVRNKHIILIDAKTNIKDYIEAENAGDDKARRAQALKEHARSVRKQIDNLASKSYATNVKNVKDGYSVLPLVGMFCPVDRALEAALSADPQLMQYAYDKGIVLLTPLTLLGFLWLVSWGWRQQAVEREFDEIRDQGRKMVEAVDLLFGDVKNAGAALRNALAAFESLEKRLENEGAGRTSVKRIAEKLIASGAAPVGKQLKNLK